LLAVLEPAIITCIIFSTNKKKINLSGRHAESALEGVAVSSRIFSVWYPVELKDDRRMHNRELRRFCLILTGLEEMISVYAF